jgi:ketosteroid isomerase-like protein
MPKQSPKTEPAAVALLHRFYECYARGDLDAIRNEVLAPDVVWTIPGRHPLAGPKRGADEILAYFDQMGKTNVKADVLYMSGDDTHVVDVHRGWGDTDGTSMDMLFVLFCSVADGRIAEVQAFAADQAQADDYFWATFSLAPIPDRLAKA